MNIHPHPNHDIVLQCFKMLSLGKKTYTESLRVISYNCVHAESLQSCPTLCNPMDCSLSVSSVHGILQARVLEWVVTACDRTIIFKYKDYFS